MKHKLLLSGLFAAAVSITFISQSKLLQADETLPTINVYKTPTCGCCNAWIDHLKDSGFTVQAHNQDNLYEYKLKAKLGAGMGSCHTAFVNGYAIEGHVPAKDIKRLLLEKPDISGITVPGMPIGSPGMEVPGQKADAYQVISYKDGKKTGIFSDYPTEK